VVENDADLDKLKEEARVLMDRACGERGSGGKRGAEQG